MAKYEYHVSGMGFDALLQHIDSQVMEKSASASFEDGSDWSGAGIRCAIRVYERYSAFGGNRVSLSITLVGGDGDIFVSAITAGGSQAVFFKINTIGENSFLEQFDMIMAPIARKY